MPRHNRVNRLAMLAGILLLLGGSDCGKRKGAIIEKLDPQRLPPLSDDLDEKSLRQAIFHSREHFRTRKDEETIALGQEQFSVRQLHDTLTTFLTLMGEGENINAGIRRYFDVYRTRDVVVTGYYEPILAGSLERQGPFRYPLYKRPDDLIEVDLSQFDRDCRGVRVVGRLSDGQLFPYYTRAEIDGRGALAGKGYELAWVDDPVKLFFLHIQGSGMIRLEGGRLLHIGYAASNGRPYHSIAQYLIDRGVLFSPRVSSMELQWYLAEHPDEKNEILFSNPRYIFFRFLEDGPVGSLGVPLTPGRSLATDRAIYPPGALAYIRTARPTVNAHGEVTAWVPFSRFMLNQDTGAALQGPRRVDLFWGSGEEAEVTAGHMRTEGELYFFVRKAVATPSP